MGEGRQAGSCGRGCSHNISQPPTSREGAKVQPFELFPSHKRRRISSLTIIPGGGRKTSEKPRRHSWRGKRGQWGKTNGRDEMKTTAHTHTRQLHQFWQLVLAAISPVGLKEVWTGEKGVMMMLIESRGKCGVRTTLT